LQKSPVKFAASVGPAGLDPDKGCGPLG